MQVIAFTGGGTGGHVYPGLAVLDELRKNPSFRFVWIGSTDGIEKEIIEKYGVEYYGVPAGKLRRYLSWSNVTDLWKILKSFLICRKILRQLKPIVLFSKGGFVSVPPVQAARSLKIPVVSHESDFDPGLATRLNSQASQKICLAYPESSQFFSDRLQNRLIVTGNPVRSLFFNGDSTWIRRTWGVAGDIPVLVVLGGSLGAVQINELVAARLQRWAEKFFVVHQTGNNWVAPPDTPWYISRPYFYSEMPDLYASADLVLTRAGAGSLWEAVAAQAPLLLVPLEAGSRGDQIRNAQIFLKAGAAQVWQSNEGEPAFDTKIEALLTSSPSRQDLKTKLKQFSAETASKTIAKILTDFATPEV